MSYSLPTGSVAQEKVASTAAASGELGPWSVEVGIEMGEARKGEETTTFFFKPSGLIATLSKFGQEKNAILLK